MIKHAVVTIKGGVGDIWAVDPDVKVHIIDYDNLEEDALADQYACPNCNEEVYDEEWNVFAEVQWRDNAAMIGEPHWQDSLFQCPYCKEISLGAKLEKKEWDD